MSAYLTPAKVGRKLKISKKLPASNYRAKNEQ